MGKINGESSLAAVPLLQYPLDALRNDARAVVLGLGTIDAAVIVRGIRKTEHNSTQYSTYLPLWYGIWVMDIHMKVRLAARGILVTG